MKLNKGKRFGKLIVVKKIYPNNKCGHSKWLCQCDCGNKVVVLSGNLQSGHTRSCGCLKGGQTTHGMTKTKTHRIWCDMFNRCQNRNNYAYKNYGARGIIVCERWKKFENFYKDMGDPPKGLTLERIDGDGDYKPNNCKWATRKEQANNSRHNVILEYKGLKLNIMQWAEKMGIKYKTLWARVNKGWPLDKAFHNIPPEVVDE